MLTQAEATAITTCITLIFSDYSVTAIQDHPQQGANQGYVVKVIPITSRPVRVTVITDLDAARRWFTSR